MQSGLKSFGGDFGGDKVNAEIGFLKELQRQLKHQSERGSNCDRQGSPRFWVIRDYRWEVTDCDFGEDSILVFDDGGDGSEILMSDDIEGFLIDEYESRHEKDMCQSVMDGLGEVDLTDEYEIKIWCEKHLGWSVRCYPAAKEPYIMPNTFFLTKKEAQRYIDTNRHNFGHHLGSQPHTYAMTALRSPQVERLWDILEAFDWDSFGKEGNRDGT